MELHDKNNRLDGIYRARVVEVDIDEDGEKNKYGSIRVFVPDFMNSNIDESIDEYKNGLIAYPANNLVGGYNNEDSDEGSFYTGTVYTPRKNSYVRVYFEGGDPSRCFYLGAWRQKNAPLPPENRGKSGGDEPHKVTTIYKSGEGRTIVVSDSRGCERVEITGKKRNISGGPAGNHQSVFKIDDNQTVILLDEREGQEKLLIRTHKGDYVNINIEKQTLEAYFKNDIIIKTDGSFNVLAKKDIHLTSDARFTAESKLNMLLSSGMITQLIAKSTLFIKSSSNIIMDGIMAYIQSKLSYPVNCGCRPPEPKGDRN